MPSKPFVSSATDITVTHGGITLRLTAIGTVLFVRGFPTYIYSNDTRYTSIAAADIDTLIEALQALKEPRP